MTALGFILTTAYWPLWANGVLVTRWAALLIVIPALLFFTKRVPAPPWSLLALLAWSFASLFWTEHFIDGVVAFVGLGLLALTFMYGGAQRDLQPFFVGVSFGLYVNCIAVAFQITGAWPWPEFSPPSGLFSNRSLLTELSAVSLVAMICHRLWWALPAPLFLIATSWNRATFLMLGAALLLWLWDQRGRTRMFAVAASVCLLAAAPMVVSLKGSSSWDRFAIVRNTLSGATVAGHGVGSFAQNYPTISDRPTLVERPAHAHMDLIEILHDLGAVGLTLFLVLLFMVFTGLPERYVLAALLTGACLGLHPLFTPHLGAMAALVAGFSFVRWRDDVRSLVAGGGAFGTRDADGAVDAGTTFAFGMPLFRQHSEGRSPVHDSKRGYPRNRGGSGKGPSPRPKLVRSADELSDSSGQAAYALRRAGAKTQTPAGAAKLQK